MGGALELSAEGASDYLQTTGRVASAPRCRALGGGVSNTVILVETEAQSFVLKQSLPQLRVKDEWFADRSRILRERDGLVEAAKLLPAGWVPEVLWSDEANYIYAMEAFSERASDWKTLLLSGDLNPQLARRAGIALGLTIRGSWRSPRLEKLFADTRAFDQLRTDPYYRTIGRRHPDIAQQVDDWIGEVSQIKLALTHGDWSPKNMLVDGSRMIFIDYECAHFGDPAYDAAFVLNHLVLKAFHFGSRNHLELASLLWTWTLAALPAPALKDFERRTARHLAFLLLARIDGKSPAEYLSEAVQDAVRRTAKRMIESKPPTIGGCLGLVHTAEPAPLRSRL